MPALAARIIVPAAVVRELAVGRAAGIDLPDVESLPWVEVRTPASSRALALVTDLGPGEAEVLALGLEARDSILILDDALARRVAAAHALRVRGTLGLLLDAKTRGLVSSIAPILDTLEGLRFRVSPQTRDAVLRLAGEAST
jgi:predicted nucleic acid-binding protein